MSPAIYRPGIPSAVGDPRPQQGRNFHACRYKLRRTHRDTARCTIQGVRRRPSIGASQARARRYAGQNPSTAPSNPFTARRFQPALRAAGVTFAKIICWGLEGDNPDRADHAVRIHLRPHSICRLYRGKKYYHKSTDRPLPDHFGIRSRLTTVIKSQKLRHRQFNDRAASPNSLGRGIVEFAFVI